MLDQANVCDQAKVTRCPASNGTDCDLPFPALPNASYLKLKKKKKRKRDWEKKKLCINAKMLKVTIKEKFW